MAEDHRAQKEDTIDRYDGLAEGVQPEEAEEFAERKRRGRPRKPVTGAVNDADDSVAQRKAELLKAQQNLSAAKAGVFEEEQELGDSQAHASAMRSRLEEQFPDQCAELRRCMKVTRNDLAHAMAEYLIMLGAEATWPRLLRSMRGDVEKVRYIAAAIHEVAGDSELIEQWVSLSKMSLTGRAVALGLMEGSSNTQKKRIASSGLHDANKTIVKVYQDAGEAIPR